MVIVYKLTKAYLIVIMKNSKKKIEEFLKRADNGEDEMFETYKY